MLRFIDLFAGIGGFRLALQNAATMHGIASQCVFSSEIDKYASFAYAANFNETPHGDITKIEASHIPNHDILLAGFPCQPFSIIGARKGFDDTRGTLFFDIARILEEKKPKAFVLENVKMLMGHNQGKTIKKIEEVLSSLGYSVFIKVLNALDFGLPQKRERVFIVGYQNEIPYVFPTAFSSSVSLEDILEKKVDKKHYASEVIIQKRKNKHKPKHIPSIWHENKSGNISSYPYSCALRAGASYNYLLVNGERRLTPREMLRLQGFPESYKIVVSDTQARKQAGNSLPVNVAQAVIEELLPWVMQEDLRQKHVCVPSVSDYREKQYA
jgi:DNA (cytosine-5)-methyltransferase 1